MLAVPVTHNTATTTIKPTCPSSCSHGLAPQSLHPSGDAPQGHSTHRFHGDKRLRRQQMLSDRCGWNDQNGKQAAEDLQRGQVGRVGDDFCHSDVPIGRGKGCTGGQIPHPRISVLLKQHVHKIRQVWSQKLSEFRQGISDSTASGEFHVGNFRPRASGCLLSRSQQTSDPTNSSLLKSRSPKPK